MFAKNSYTKIHWFAGELNNHLVNASICGENGQALCGVNIKNSPSKRSSSSIPDVLWLSFRTFAQMRLMARTMDERRVGFCVVIRG